MKKDVRVRGYFLKSKVVREQKSLETTAVWRLCNTNHRSVDGYFVHYTTHIICIDYISSDGVNVASFDCVGRGRRCGRTLHKALECPGLWAQVRTREHQYTKQELHPLNCIAGDCTV